ncbi:MAG TPA: hypothetical protein VGW75_07730 [Solirubrobacteraceae bacterium]|jgi:hypothetical protein|nr:hypothetical protein [Solirubrobacteraceae bacterium]
MAATSTFHMGGRQFAVTRADVERAARSELPAPVRDYYVVVRGRRYPPKQVLALLTGLPRSRFTTHHAVRTLRRLGFPVGRKPRAAGPARPSPAASAPDPVAALRAHAGQWVAVRAGDVLVAAADARTVVSWLSEHGQRADSMFRVPLDAAQASGIAPR